MNDRFKFRAWNKLSNEMKDVISLNINYEFPECSNVILETNTFDNIKTHNNPITCSNGLNNVVLMQCTGLKDKNGRLIYEGDIVKFNYDTDEIIAVVSWDDNEGQIGYYLNTTDYFKDKYVTDYDFYKNDYEVIGNIYEDKDLLDA